MSSVDESWMRQAARACRTWSRPRRAEPASSGASPRCATASSSAKAGIAKIRRPACRGRERSARPAHVPRGHAVRDAGAVLPSRQDAPLHRRDPDRGHQPGVRGPRGSVPAGRRPKGQKILHEEPACRSSSASRAAEARRQNAPYLTAARRLGRPHARQMGDERSTQDRDDHRRLEVDLRRRKNRSVRPRVARPNGRRPRRHRHRGSPTIRC